MESFKLYLIIFAFVIVLFYFVISFKKHKGTELNDKFQRMEKEGDFKGIKQMFGKMAIIWSVIAFAVLAISVIRIFTDGFRALTGFIIGAVLAWRAYDLIRKWSAYKKLEQRISYRMSNQEVKEFWLQDNESIFGGLEDYLFKKSYMEGYMEMLNHQEKVFYVLAKLEIEVNNGGFSQFFFNTGEKYNNDIVRYAYEVGARDIAKICERALGILKRNLSEDETDTLLNDECDKAFYASEDYLIDLCANYARNHKNYFLS